MWPTRSIVMMRIRIIIMMRVHIRRRFGGDLHLVVTEAVEVDGEAHEVDTQNDHPEGHGEDDGAAVTRGHGDQLFIGETTNAAGRGHIAAVVDICR